jgi:hypothetical protein
MTRSTSCTSQRFFDKVLEGDLEGQAVDTVVPPLASRYHERFADHAVSIAKKVQYHSYRRLGRRARAFPPGLTTATRFSRRWAQKQGMVALVGAPDLRTAP